MCIRDRLEGDASNDTFVAALAEAGHPVVTLRLADRYDIGCLLYTSDAADERSSVDLGGRRIIKKKNTCKAMKGDE